MSRIEKLHRHMKRTYENELTINTDGTISHDDCIDHCLLYAFGECDELQSLRCQGCQEHFELFDFMKPYVSSDEFSQYAEIRDRLQYFLSHQTIKVYLNEDGLCIQFLYLQKSLVKIT